MATRSITAPGAALQRGPAVPEAVAAAGPEAARRFVEFFAAGIRNRNTRESYAAAIASFLDWCGSRGVRDVRQVRPLVVAGYVEDLSTAYSKATVKQHLAAVRMLFDWLVTGQVVPVNPAASVRGPSLVVKRGKTPVLSAEQARELLDSIEPTSPLGLRDRAVIGVMVYTFARVSAVCGILVGDYYPEGKRWWIRLHEKGGKRHPVPVHHQLEQYMDAYLDACLPPQQRRRDAPLFRSADRAGRLTGRGLTRNDVLRMIKRRAAAAGLPASTCCHTFRATGITAYLENGGTIENAQAIAGHESPRTTKLYDRTSDAISLDEIERIRI